MAIKQTMKISELLAHLNTFNPDDDLFFASGELTFYRTKRRGDHLVQIEFNEVIKADGLVEFSDDLTLKRINK